MFSFNLRDIFTPSECGLKVSQKFDNVVSYLFTLTVTYFITQGSWQEDGVIWLTFPQWFR